MDFGKLENLKGVNFALPVDSLGTQKLLATLAKDYKPKLFVGCPTWKEKCFVGKIYPFAAGEKEYLYHYSRQFNTLELNSTYYGIPRKEVIRGWVQKVPLGFHFCPKVTLEISHEQQLQNAHNSTQKYCEAITEFGETLGIAFLVLPPDFGPHKFAILENYLQSFPKDIPLSIEMRHRGWFYNDAVFQMLEAQGISAVITDVAGRRDVLHQRLTTTTTVIRFVGNDLHSSDYTRIDDWCQRLTQWFKNGLQSAYFFIHQPQREFAIDLSMYFMEKMNALLNLQLKKPRFVEQNIQQTFDF